MKISLCFIIHRKMTDPTSNNKREDNLPNVVLEADPFLNNSSEQGAPQEEVPTGTNPPPEPETEEKEGENVPCSRSVTPDSEKGNNRPRRKVNIQGQNEENENGPKIWGNVDLEVNVNGDADISVTLNIDKCPIQNLRVRRCHYFL